jgi:DAACS family dicarboxylate/amino acid:cation (Na+ or H+) symporter
MRIPPSARILIGALLGVVAGGIANALWSGSEGLAAAITHGARPVGQIFLRLLFMLVVPLMFSALVLGVSEFGDLRRLGRVGAKTLAYTIVVSLIAVMLGVVMVNVFRPGEGVSAETQAQLRAIAAERGSAIATAAPPRSGVELIVRLVPDNPIKAAAEGDYLAWMFFALMVGIGMCIVRTDATARLRTVLEGLYQVCMALIRVVIWTAPIGVMALLFTLTAEFGWGVLVQLARYVAVVVGALAIHQFIVYSLTVKLLGGMSPFAFFRAVQAAMITAFSTASSNATLPTALQVADENLRLPPAVSRFVLTLGATANQNGTALFEGVTVLFLAQFYGVELSVAQQVTVVLMCVLGGIGTAGVPAGSIPVVAMILGMVGVPVEGIGLILGVDRFLDMCRTTLNVTGDLAAAVVVSRGEPG